MSKQKTSYYTGHVYRGFEAGFVEGAVAMEDGYVVEEGPSHSFRTLDGNKVERNVIIAPLFFNAHTHLGDSFITDTISGGLEGMVIPPHGIKHQRLRDASVERIAEGILQEMKGMARSGTGFFCEYREGGLSGLGAMSTARKRAEEVGASVPEALVLGRPAGEPMTEIEATMDRSDGIGLSSLSDFEPETIECMVRRTRDRGKIFSAHHSEGRREKIDFPIESRVWPLVHMSCATPGDIDAVGASGLPVALCPRSNLMFSLMPNVHHMVEAGLEILLGTDNAFITRPDMFTELDILFRTYMHMAPEDSGPVDPAVRTLYRASLGIPLLRHGMENLGGRRKEAFGAGYEMAVNGISEGRKIPYQAIRNRFGAGTGQVEYFMVNRASAADIISVRMPGTHRGHRTE